MFAVSPIQPVTPLPYHPPPILHQAAQVARDAVVAEMALELQSELFHLPAQCLVAIFPTPFGYSPQRLIQPLARSLSHHRPSTFPTLAPVMGHSQKVERPRWWLFAGAGPR